MSWKTIFITQDCKILTEKKNLIIKINNKKNSVFIDDISTIVFETDQVSITLKAIQKLVKSGVVLIGIDEYFLPSSIIMPFYGHSLYSKIAHMQINMTEPFKKRMWQQIIKSKIKNQAMVLEFFNKKKTAKKLFGLSSMILSGDSSNLEAQAARIYWSDLFDDFFRTSKGAIDINNSALNYGYAIIRSAVARSMVGVGLMPVFGIFHKNYFNAFNFVDDIMEPYRPVVDLHLRVILDSFRDDFLTNELKLKIVNILNMDFLQIDDGLSQVRSSIDKTLQSVKKSIVEKNLNFLRLPEIDFESYIKTYECI